MGFTFTKATRSRVPLLIALSGPTGTGKTFSALRLAVGIQSVDAGPIGMIDTEASRGLHYADDFDFLHVPLGPPFGPARYLEAIEAAVAQGVGTLIIDSGSHEHEGPGGVLEMHDELALKMARGDHKRAQKMTMPAWGPVKRERRAMIARLLQLPINLIVCFRAKEKLKIERGKDPEPRGFMAITGDEWIYEMGVSFLLRPGASGVPTWKSGFEGELQTIKRPRWASDLLPDGKRIDEAMGAALASWAAGAKTRTAAELVELYATAGDSATVGVLERDRRAIWSKCSREERADLKVASDDAQSRVTAAESAPAIEGDQDDAEPTEPTETETEKASEQ